MFLLGRPSAADVNRFLDASREVALSYQPIGITVTGPPPGFVADELVTVVGQGEKTFERAKAALTGWKHLDLGWVDLQPAGVSSEPGATVVLLVRHVGFWSMNACRVLPPLRQAPAGVFELSYGALANHVAAGEEVFRVTFDSETGEVRYTIRAVSRPRAALAWLGYPITRRLQVKFRRDSALALIRAITG